MRDDIRKRIEAVRQGEVPEGYTVENHQLRPQDWKYEKIGKYLTAHDEFSNDTEKYALATSSRQGLMPQTDYYSDQRFEETTGGFHVVPEGYITYRHMSDDDVFKFNLNSLGAPVLVSPEYLVFTTTGELNKNLLIEYLNGMKEFRAYCSAQKKGSTRTRMYFSRLGDFVMPIPPVAEQGQIAEILSACDRAIDLKQKLVEELQSLKKTCLAKLFPREGFDVPEIRFPGFTGSWSPCKVVDIASETRGGGTPATSNELFWIGDIPWIQSSDLSEGILFGVEPRKHISQAGLDNSATQLVPGGSIAVVTRVGVGKLAFLPCSYATSQDLLSLCGLNADPYFTVYGLFHLLQREMRVVQGTSIKGMTKEDLLSKPISVPRDVKEQTQIGVFFKNLDTLITFHQRELEATQQKKKALMQLLLTGLVRVQV